MSNSVKAQCVDTLMRDIYTPLGNMVATYANCELSLKFRISRDDIYKKTYPNAQQIITYEGASSTARFNCHGYAWIMVEQGIDRWVTHNFQTGKPTSELFITEGSYIKVAQETFPGKVYWEGATHSAITTEDPGWFISKWHFEILCRHRWDYSPYGTDFDYYVRNCHNKIENETITSDRNIASCGDIEIINVGILNDVNVNVLAEDLVVLKPGFHAITGSNVFVGIGSAVTSFLQPQNSLLIMNDESSDIFDKTENIDIMIQNKPNIKLFPNPNLGTFQLETNFPLSDIALIKITNLLGVTVYETQNPTSNTIQLPATASGQHFVVLILKTGKVLTQKMMVQR